MSGLELLADSGPLAGLVGIVGWLLRRLTAEVLREVKALRSELAAHVKQDDERHLGVKAGIRQMWRHLNIERAASDDERPS